MLSTLNRRQMLKASGMAGAAALMPGWARAQQNAISYWHTFTSQTEVAGLQRVVEMFTAAQSAVTVTPENIPNPEFMAKITAAVVAGSNPDTSMVTGERFADLLAMGALVDLTDRLEGWNRRADFDDARFASIRDSEGRIYGLPAFAFVDWMYYRKDWFDVAGLTVPTTYDEFRQAAIAMTDASKNRYGFSLRGAAGGQQYVVQVMEAFGAKLVNEDGIRLDRDPAIAAVDFWAGLLTRDAAVPPSAPNDGFRQIMEAFQTGQTAMIWHHTGSFRDISNMLEAGVQFATAPIPAGPVNRVSRLSYAYNAVTKSDTADSGWEWVKFWGEPDAAVALLEETGYFPASNMAAADPRIADNPLYAPAAETLSFGVPHPNFVGYSGWAEGVVLPAFQRVLIGQSTAEQAVDEMIEGLRASIE